MQTAIIDENGTQVGRILVNHEEIQTVLLSDDILKTNLREQYLFGFFDPEILPIEDMDFSCLILYNSEELAERYWKYDPSDSYDDISDY